MKLYEPTEDEECAPVVSPETPGDIYPTPILDRSTLTILSPHKAGLIQEHLGGITTIRELAAFLETGGDLTTVPYIGDSIAPKIQALVAEELARIPDMSKPPRVLPHNYLLDEEETP